MDIILVFKVLFLGFIEGLMEFLFIFSIGYLILFGYLIDFYLGLGCVFEVVI